VAGPSDLPPEIPQFRLGTSVPGALSPFIYGSARLYFGDSRRADEVRQVHAMVAIEPGMRSVDWDRAELVELRPDDLIAAAAGAGGSQPLPPVLTDLQRFSRVARDFHRWLGRVQRAEAFRHSPLKMTSKPGESEDAFLERVRQALQKKRDLLADRLRRKRKSKQPLTQTEAELEALPELEEIQPGALEKMAMRPRRGGTTVDLVAVVWK
jgi:hypothetical protein